MSVALVIVAIIAASLISRMAPPVACAMLRTVVSRVAGAIALSSGLVLSGCAASSGFPAPPRVGELSARPDVPTVRDVSTVRGGVSSSVWPPARMHPPGHADPEPPRFLAKSGTALTMAATNGASFADGPPASFPIPADPEWIFPELFLTGFPSFDSPRLDAQIHLYAAYLAAFGPPDVLIVGSSRALQGIDPAVLQNTLAAQGYPGIRVYNFSINGATARVVDLMVRRVLTPDQLPDMILWGDGSRAFNSGRSDATYARIAESQGYARLQQGDRPIAYNRFRFPPPQICPDSSSPATPSPDSPIRTPFESYHTGTFPDAPDPAPFPQTPGIEDFLLPCIEETPLLESRPLGWPRRPRRWERDRHILQQRWVRRHGNGLNGQGFLTVSEQFEPTTYYRQYPKVPGAYDSNYVPFQLDGEQTEATFRLAAYLRDQGIPLVVVNLPLTQDYLDAFRQQREALFQQHMARLAQQGGFWFRDLNRAELSPNAYFADPSHLNQAGARAVASHLAQDATLPWSNLSTR